MMGKTLAFRFYSFICRAPYEHLSAANIEIAKLEAEVFFKIQQQDLSSTCCASPGEGDPVAGGAL